MSRESMAKWRQQISEYFWGLFVRCLIHCLFVDVLCDNCIDSWNVIYCYLCRNCRYLRSHMFWTAGINNYPFIRVRCMMQSKRYTFYNVYYRIISFLSKLKILGTFIIGFKLAWLYIYFWMEGKYWKSMKDQLESFLFARIWDTLLSAW